VKFKDFQPGEQRLTLEVDSTLRLLVTGFLDVGNASLKAESTVSFGGSGTPLEVVFAVDVTADTRDLADPLQTWAENQLSRADNTLALGIVPFSQVVNVGTDATQQEWVKSWQNQIAAGIPAARTAHLPADYVSTTWSGCIAEPQPWTAPAQHGQGLAPLTPSAGFIPLFARVNTSFYWNANAGKASTPD